MATTDTRLLAPDEAGVAEAARLLRAGRLVGFPTETVYGLGADATDGRAVARIFEAKGRPRFNPLIVHLPSIEAARRIGRFDATAERLADAFWPGPLTLVLPLAEEAGLSDLVTAGLSTVALRLPDHDLAGQLMRAVGRPLAGPSANPSGRLSPTRAEHVLDGLGGGIDAVLDGGATGVGVESTIVGCEGPPSLLRPGGLPVEIIEACLGRELARPEAGETPNAPGQLASHYAPSAVLRLNAAGPEAGEVFLGFGSEGADLDLSPSGDLTEAAANLFAYLRQLDARTEGRIAVARVPERGLGRAINDRLARAAAPRRPG